MVLRQPNGVEAEVLGKHHLIDFLGQDLGASPPWWRLQEEVGSKAHYKP
jgi:hypothetical protein